MTMEIEMPERVEHGMPQPATPEDPPITDHTEVAAAPVVEGPAGAGPGGAPAVGEPPRPAKSLTIGAVCKSLEREFPEISISKIRYLEDQKLLSPRRTRGGYRLYSPDDVQRLRTILRLQRDEFLPLRVIRQELAAGRADREVGSGPGGRQQGPDPRALRRATVTVRDKSAPLYRLADVLEETGAEASLVKELEDYGVIKGERREGEQYYDDTEKEIIRAVAELARFGVGGRNLRVFRTSADREAALLEQILAPSLRSRNPERRREAVEALENLAATASHLKYLLLVRDLRRITS
jgi:DNA-binding transcriptional MerR regulator